MRNEAKVGVENWLFEENKKFDRSIFSINGSNFLDSFYITQAHKCPDFGKEITPKIRNKVNDICSEHFLKTEINLIKPEVIFAFGKYALSAVSKCFGQESKIRSFNIKEIFKSIEEPRSFKGFVWNTTLILPIPHPDSLWRNPHISKVDFEKYFKIWVREAENYVNEISQQS